MFRGLFSANPCLPKLINFKNKKTILNKIRSTLQSTVSKLLIDKEDLLMQLFLRPFNGTGTIDSHGDWCRSGVSDAEKPQKG